MKFKALILLLVISVISCERSTGVKYGTLQKVSHKTFPINCYVVELSYEGGRQVSNGESSAYQNTQQVAIDKKAFDTLQKYVGNKVIFDYKDLGFNGIGKPTKVLTSIKIKI